jgi:hypothetical protein
MGRATVEQGLPVLRIVLQAFAEGGNGLLLLIGCRQTVAAFECRSWFPLSFSLRLAATWLAGRFIQNGNAQLFGLGQLAACFCASHHEVGFLGDAAGNLAAGGFDHGLGLIA